MSDVKRHPNRARYLETLRSMTPEQRLLKVQELSEMTQELLRVGIRERFPDASDEERHRIYLDRIERCRRRTC